MLCLLGGACAKESSQAKEAAHAKQTAANGNDSEMVSGEPGGEASTEKSTSGSAEAYEKVKNQIREAQRTSHDQDEFLATVERLFVKFVKDYPGTQETADAQLNLGSLYYQTGRTDKAVQILYEVIDGGTASNEQVGYAHFVLAEAYKNSDQFDNAKREYNTVINEFSFLPAQVIQMARSGLGDLDALKKLAVGSKPIPFEVKDTDGHVINFVDGYKGKVVLLDFWATWCGPCRVDMPHVIDVYKKQHKNGFEIVGISLDRSREALDRYVDANNMDWPQYFDGKYWQNEIAMKYMVRQIPTSFLIDKQGVIRYRSLRGSQLEAAVVKLLKETS